ncbi:DUF722 domain-containing protein [Weissella confusa]|uniref:DUF722 domain-containing protein n=1 Tax=Weissella confusa TaxID=1583 RepID=UPI00189CEB38|nr:DUF722 domain-containing protein [Weissella confusa]MBF7058581.1 DUF722 domain-containing protein [Weissella confusa]
MADKVDKLLRDYFDGTMDKQIKAREMYLQFHNDVDENVGGGRAQYKFNNAVESQMITLEQDYELRELNHNKMIVEMWLNGLGQDEYDILDMHYGMRYTWYKISLELNKSVTALQRWKREFKISVSHYVDL